MFCGYCGAKLPDNAEFCDNCGKATEGQAKDKLPAKLANLKKDKKNHKKMLGIAGIIALVAVMAIAVSAIAGKVAEEKQKKEEENRKVAEEKQREEEENLRIGQLEDAIFSISSLTDENEIARLYEEYNTLSDSAKRKVTNRETLIRAYQEVEALIAQRKQAAAQVDKVIGAIDYSNIYAKASTVGDAARAYNSLNEQERGYVASYDRLKKAYDDVGNLNIAITADNFWDLFVIEYAVGSRANYGAGTVTTQNGYTIDWNRYGGSITPKYDVDTYNDYATPVYIYIAPRYPNLACECSFYINLHQTYYGIGLVDSDLHEFKLQSATIQYDSSQGICEYVIAVEDNDASSSLWNLVGLSFDWSDSVHEMNPFDASRVEISNVSGSVKY